MKNLPSIALGAVGAAFLCAAGVAFAARTTSGIMQQVNGPYVSGTTISSAQINSRFSDIENELTNSLDRSGRGGFLASFRTIDGTVAAPAHSFTNEPGTGLYRAGASNPAMAVNGALAQSWTSTGSSITGTLSASGAATFGGLSLSAPLAISGGGTGSATQNFVDLTTGQSVGGVKTFTSQPTVAGILIGSSGNAISASFRGTTSWTPGAVAATTQVQTTITLTGAAAGADCAVAPPSSLGYLTLTCWVTANTCNLTVGNPSAGVFPAPTGTYTCRVFNP